MSMCLLVFTDTHTPGQIVRKRSIMYYDLGKVMGKQCFYFNSLTLWNFYCLLRVNGMAAWAETFPKQGSSVMALITLDSH